MWKMIQTYPNICRHPATFPFLLLLHQWLCDLLVGEWSRQWVLFCWTEASSSQPMGVRPVSVLRVSLVWWFHLQMFPAMEYILLLYHSHWSEECWKQFLHIKLMQMTHCAFSYHRTMHFHIHRANLRKLLLRFLWAYALQNKTKGVCEKFVRSNPLPIGPLAQEFCVQFGFVEENGLLLDSPP